MPSSIGAGTSAGILSLQKANSIFQKSQKSFAAGPAAANAVNDPTAFALSQSMAATLSELKSYTASISLNKVSAQAAQASVRYAQGLLQQMNNVATAALNAGTTALAPGQASGGSGRVIAALPTATIDANTAVDIPSGGPSVPQVLSITTDSGKNFTYTVSGPTTWGDIANAANASNTGVTMRFDTSSGSSRLVIEAGEGFSIDQWSSRAIVDDLAGINSPYDGGYNILAFGLTNPADRPGQVWVSPTTVGGLRFGDGGAVTAVGNVFKVTAGSSLTFTGSDGVSHTWTASANTTLEQVSSDINAMNAGVQAEFAFGGKLRLRDENGGQITVNGGTGVFDPVSGASRFTQTTGAPVALPPPPAGSSTAQQQSFYGNLYNQLQGELSTLVNGPDFPDLYMSWKPGMPELPGPQKVAASYYLPGPANWASSGDIAASLTKGQDMHHSLDMFQMSWDWSNMNAVIEGKQSLYADLSSSSLFANDHVGLAAALVSATNSQQYAGQAITAENKAAKALLKMLAF